MTPRMKRCHDYLLAQFALGNTSPTLEQIAIAVGLGPKSKSNAHRLLAALADRGVIEPRVKRYNRVIRFTPRYAPPAYPRPVPVLDTSSGYKFFTVVKDGPETPARLVELAR